MNSWNKFLHNDYFSLIVRLVVGLIFIYASIDKISNSAQFARIIYNYHLLPGELVNLWALTLPWVEMICGILLVAGIYKEGSVLILNVLVLTFILAVGINLFRGVDLECGCFTVSSRAKGSTLNLLMRDIGLLVLTIYLFFNRSRRFTLMKSAS